MPDVFADFAVWVVAFGFGSIFSWLVWLTLRHYDYAMPAYKRLFGHDADDTSEGHLVESDDRFDDLDEAHAMLSNEVNELRGDVRKIDRRQETVLKNQRAIADALDVDVDEPRFRSARRERDD